MEEKGSIKSFLLSKLGKAVVMIVGYIIIISLIYVAVMSDITAIFVVVVAMCTFFGWKALDRITPQLFLIMPIGKWITYWVVKGVLSIFVGVFTAPYQLTKMIVKKFSEEE